MSKLSGLPDLSSPLFKPWLEAVARQQIVETLFRSTASAECSGTSETELASYTLRPNVLSGEGETIYIVATGTYAATANNKRIKIKLGSTTLFDTSSVAIITAVSWLLETRIMRLGSATAKVYTEFTTGSSVLPVTVGSSSPTEDFTVKNNIVITGQGGATSDITFTYWKAFLEP